MNPCAICDIRSVARMARRVGDHRTVGIEPEQSRPGVIVVEARREKRNVRHNIFVIHNWVTCLRTCSGSDPVTECFVTHPRAAERVQVGCRVGEVRECKGSQRRSQAVSGDANILNRMIFRYAATSRLTCHPAHTRCFVVAPNGNRAMPTPPPCATPSLVRLSPRLPRPDFAECHR